MMPRQARASRSADTRSMANRRNSSRPMQEDKQKRLLDIPQSEIPRGMTYTWMRVSTLNEADHGNWQRKIGKGWSPVPRERHANRFPILNVPGLSDSRYDSVIVLGGLLLVERPTRDVDEDKADIERETAEQIESVDWDNRTDEGLKDTPRFTDRGSKGIQVERTVAEFKGDDE